MMQEEISTRSPPSRAKILAMQAEPAGGGTGNNDPWRQHVVTRYLLANWAPDGELIAHDLWRDSAQRRSPRAEGFVPSLVADGSAAIEARWKELEDAARPAVERLGAVDLLDDAKAMASLRDLLALHLARSKTVDVMWERSLRENDEVAALWKLIHDPAVLDAVFEERTGLKPAGPAARLEALEYLTALFEERLGQHRKGFRDALVEQVETARERLSSAFLEIGHAQGCDFLIGDSPMQPYDRDSRRVGFLNGVTLDQADYLGMPLTPQFTVGITTRGPHRMIEVHAPAVARLNEIQLWTAHWKVYYRPGSDLAGMASEHAAQRSGAPADTIRRFTGQANSGRK